MDGHLDHPVGLERGEVGNGLRETGLSDLIV
jgi:hypothetical protein